MGLSAVPGPAADNQIHMAVIVQIAHGDGFHEGAGRYHTQGTVGIGFKRTVAQIADQQVFPCRRLRPAAPPAGCL